MGPLLVQILFIKYEFPQGVKKTRRLTFGMLVTQGTLSHVGQLYRSFAAGIHEPIAALWMEFCSSNNFCQFFHVGGFYVNNVKALVLDI